MDTTALLSWYRDNARALPWRGEPPDPYWVWLSEIMAQQTRIETMLPYWRSFTQRWPTVQDLAQADLDEVLQAWAGLGYYSRARNLHKAAQQVSQLGAFPLGADQLQRLPGVGPYTAGAIASIAQGRDAALVDGNVERVLCRQARVTEDPRTPAIKRRLWELAAQHLPAGQAGDYNQALMELGASLCSPKRPSCLGCPIQSSCAGREIAESLPNKPRRTKAPQVRAACVWLEEQGRVLLVRRPDTGLLAGLWELPGVELAVNSQDSEALALVAGLRERLGLDVSLCPRLGEIRHTFTHRRLRCGVWKGGHQGALSLAHYSAAAWFEPDQIASGPALSTMAKKCLRLCSAEGVHGQQLLL